MTFSPPITCTFKAIFDDSAPADRCWIAVQIGQDGCATELDRFDNQDDAEYFADAMRQLMEAEYARKLRREAVIFDFAVPSALAALAIVNTAMIVLH